MIHNRPFIIYLFQKIKNLSVFIIYFFDDLICLQKMLKKIIFDFRYVKVTESITND